MSQDGTARVILVSARVDVELAINLWLPGYSVRRLEDQIAIRVAMSEGELVLADPGFQPAAELLSALPADQPHPRVLVLETVPCTTIDLDRDRYVTTPLDLASLRASLDRARSDQRSTQDQPVAQQGVLFVASGNRPDRRVRPTGTAQLSDGQRRRIRKLF